MRERERERERERGREGTLSQGNEKKTRNKKLY